MVYFKSEIFQFYASQRYNSTTIERLQALLMICQRKETDLCGWVNS